MINFSRSMSTIAAAALAFFIASNLNAQLQPRENVALLERPTISYLTSSSEGRGIHLIDSDGQNRRLWVEGAFLLAPSWSLDGRRASMIEASREGYDLYVFDIETQQMTFVSELLNENRNEHQRIVISAAWWFPDGKKLVCRGKAVNQIYSELYVLNPDTLEIKNKTRTPDISEGWASVSPDGRKIVCSGWGENTGEIYVMSSTGADRINITNTPPASERYPAWSPDGNWIAFEAAFRDDQEEDSLDIFIMRPDGSDVRKLTSRADGRFKEVGDWSRDSKWVVITIPNEDGSGLRDLYRIHIETGEKVRITDDDLPKAGTATWVLTGRRVLSVDPAGKKKEPWGALKLLMNDESAADE